jgi:hypothetical protein
MMRGKGGVDGGRGQSCYGNLRATILAISLWVCLQGTCVMAKCANVCLSLSLSLCVCVYARGSVRCVHTSGCMRGSMY